MPEDPRFTTPLYTISEGARYLKVPASTFATWAHGYRRQAPGRREVVGEAILTTVAAAPGQPEVPFVGLVEGMVAASFRRAGVSMQHIRRALEVIRKEIGLNHALASKRLYTDGASILYDYASRTEDEEILAAVVTGQRSFRPLIQDYLRMITYASDKWATKLVLPITDRPVVLVDPSRAFGSPVFIRGGARMEDVLGRFAAGEPLGSVAQDFGLSAEDVEAVIRAALPPAA